MCAALSRSDTLVIGGTSAHSLPRCASRTRVHVGLHGTARGRPSVRTATVTPLQALTDVVVSAPAFHWQHRYIQVRASWTTHDSGVAGAVWCVAPTRARLRYTPPAGSCINYFENKIKSPKGDKVAYISHIKNPTPPRTRCGPPQAPCGQEAHCAMPTQVGHGGQPRTATRRPSEERACSDA